MTQIIKRLEAHVANQIAAGEVVQRPASIVKELMENAVDAGATEISLYIKEGGKLSIELIDNGHGMSETDASLCFERHATSKLSTAQDLFNINTKGFRGEALASIAAIAQVVMKTKREADQLGTEVHISGGRIEMKKESVCNTGTSFTVNNLFYNIPARRNFLKSKQIEQRHITDEFHRLALVHPEISFSFYADDSPLFILKPSSFAQRIVQIFGKKIQDKLVPVSEETPNIRIEGFILKPELAKKTKGTQFFFVNHRFIKSSSLHFGVVNAFEGLIPKGLHPGYFIHISLPAEQIDINIHPTKTEIKFEDEHTLFAILRSAIKHALGQYQIAPVLDFDRDPSLDPSYNGAKLAGAVPQISVDASFNPFEATPAPSKKSAPFKTYKSQSSSWEALYSTLDHKQSDHEAFRVEETKPLSFEDPWEQPALFSEVSGLDTQTNCFQLHKKYILTPTKSGVLVIHQSRAHQRILYEEFLHHFTHEGAGSQQLLFPKEITFTRPEIALLEELSPALGSLGFQMSISTPDAVSVTGIPVAISENQLATLLSDFLDSFQNNKTEADFSQTDILAKSLAKSMGVKTGSVLSLEEQQHMINTLFACKEPTLSPFGKSVFHTISQTDLDLKFL